MEFYLAIIIALVMAAVAGGLYYYVLFLESRARQMKRRINELERANVELIEEASQMREELDARGDDDGGEFWPEVLDEKDISRN